jgi:hypothetical protein
MGLNAVERTGALPHTTGVLDGNLSASKAIILRPELGGRKIASATAPLRSKPSHASGNGGGSSTSVAYERLTTFWHQQSAYRLPRDSLDNKHLFC